ncbi:hypothetical protein C7H19_23985 [Aphanothece hegewaldii CCALA 016]|uniref:Uncharacterized protein n=1 Tax=Aphanothece hegewaldii CCALA 016 TaxID=2107694 RepID=A0A2T1LQZ9_9CHRO|nr:hypothetical protein [Aphanothece hegewaldii]PSF30243.1 hypothetical protein C7H19_23985 [Aphanothece hegewaldii CCALA 016]
MPRRARISDNDPLNKTEKVLERFEQISQPASEPVEQLTSQQDHTPEQPESSEAEPLTTQPATEEVDEQPSILESEPVINITSQKDDKKTSRTLSRSQDSKLTTQQVEQPTSTKTEDSTSYQVEKPTSQKEDLPAVELKKATFQLDKAVLTKLEKFVLSLQLELGKENAPYKEVIVEEAIERLLNNDPSKILKALERRQKRRK